jgi:hypothetical protein
MKIIDFHACIPTTLLLPQQRHVCTIWLCCIASSSSLIFWIDHVAGDAESKRKPLGKMQDISQGMQSQHMAAVKQLCTRVLC